MSVSDKIRIGIIDNDEEIIFALKEYLGFFPEVEVMGCATKYKQAKSLLLREDVDLVFMDVEMPDRTGFELLDEVRKFRKKLFSFIIYTTGDKYLIQGLRNSAFDYIIKPIKREELRNAIDRFISKRNSEQPANPPLFNHLLAEIISLPTPIGLRFMDKNSIVLFQCCTREKMNDKTIWTVLLTDMTEVKLRTGTNAKEILELMGEKKFIPVNQSTILNINYLGSIEFKTRDCLLIPPFTELKLTASRNHLYNLRNKFDTL